MRYSPQAERGRGLSPQQRRWRRGSTWAGTRTRRAATAMPATEARRALDCRGDCGRRRPAQETRRAASPARVLQVLSPPCAAARLALWRRQPRWSRRPPSCSSPTRTTPEASPSTPAPSAGSTWTSSSSARSRARAGARAALFLPPTLLVPPLDRVSPLASLRSATPLTPRSDFLAASPLLDSRAAPFPAQAGGTDSPPAAAGVVRSTLPGAPKQAFVPALDLAGERRERAARFYAWARGRASAAASGAGQQRSPAAAPGPSRRRRRRSSSYSQSADSSRCGKEAPPAPAREAPWAGRSKAGGAVAGESGSAAAPVTGATEEEQRGVAEPAFGSRTPAQLREEARPGQSDPGGGAPAAESPSSAWPPLSASPAPVAKRVGAAGQGASGVAHCAGPAGAATPTRQAPPLTWAEGHAQSPRGRGASAPGGEAPSLRRLLSEESAPPSEGRGRVSGSGPQRGARRRAKGKGRAVDLGAFLQGPSSAGPKPAWAGPTQSASNGVEAAEGAGAGAEAAPSLSDVLAEHEAERARREAFHRTLAHAAPHARRVETDGHQTGGWGMVPEGPQRTLADIMGDQAVDEERQRLAEAEEEAVQQAIRASLAEAGGGDSSQKGPARRGSGAPRGGQRQARTSGRGRRGGRGGRVRGRDGGDQHTAGHRGGAGGARGGNQCRRVATTLSAGASTFVPRRK